MVLCLISLVLRGMRWSSEVRRVSLESRALKAKNKSQQLFSIGRVYMYLEHPQGLDRHETVPMKKSGERSKVETRMCG